MRYELYISGFIYIDFIQVDIITVCRKKYLFFAHFVRK